MSWIRFLFKRCPVCELRWCPVWGAGITNPPMSVYMMHRGFRI